MVAVAAQNLLGQGKELGFFKAGVGLVVGNQLVQFAHIEVGAVSFGHRLQALLQLLPQRFNGAVFVGQAFGHGFNSGEFIAGLRAGDHGGEEFALLLQVVFEDGFTEKFQRFLSDLAGASGRLKKRGQFVQGLQTLDDAHMAVVEIADGGFEVGGGHGGLQRIRRAGAAGAPVPLENLLPPV